MPYFHILFVLRSDPQLTEGNVYILFVLQADPNLSEEQIAGKY